MTMMYALCFFLLLHPLLVLSDHDSGDLYVVILLRPLSKEIVTEQSEIAEAKWLPVRAQCTCACGICMSAK